LVMKKYFALRPEGSRRGATRPPPVAGGGREASGSGLYFQGGCDRRRKYRAPQQDGGSSPPSATNIANRTRYRFGKPRNHSGFGVLLYHFLKLKSKDIISQKRPLGRT